MHEIFGVAPIFSDCRLERNDEYRHEYADENEDEEEEEGVGPGHSHECVWHNQFVRVEGAQNEKDHRLQRVFKGVEDVHVGAENQVHNEHKAAKAGH